MPSCRLSNGFHSHAGGHQMAHKRRTSESNSLYQTYSKSVCTTERDCHRLTSIPLSLLIHFSLTRPCWVLRPSSTASLQINLDFQSCAHLHIVSSVWGRSQDAAPLLSLWLQYWVPPSIISTGISNTIQSRKVKRARKPCASSFWGGGSVSQPNRPDCLRAPHRQQSCS